MRQVVNNRTVTILCIGLMAVACVSYIASHFADHQLYSISEISFVSFFVLCLIQIIANGTTVYIKKYVVLFSIITAVQFVSAITVLGSHFNVFVVLSIRAGSNLLIGITYTIRYIYKPTKQILDKAKLIWVIGLMMLTLVTAIIKIQHWPGREYLEFMDGLWFLMLATVFYYDGFKKGYLLKPI